jgi:hypothetical protein
MPPESDECYHSQNTLLEIGVLAHGHAPDASKAVLIRNHWEGRSGREMRNVRATDLAYVLRTRTIDTILASGMHTPSGGILIAASSSRFRCRFSVFPPNSTTVFPLRPSRSQQSGVWHNYIFPSCDGLSAGGCRDLPAFQYSRIAIPAIKSLDYPRKVVTIEPVLDFDVEEFAGWIIDLRLSFRACWDAIVSWNCRNRCRILQIQGGMLPLGTTGGLGWGTRLLKKSR